MCAGQAGASVMVATLNGDWSVDDYYKSWTAQITYDTSLASLITDSDGTELVWHAGDGPSPILSVTGTLFGLTSWTPSYPGTPAQFTPVPNFTFSLTGLTSFLFDQTPTGDLISVSNGTQTFSAGSTFAAGCLGPTPCAVVPFDQPQTVSLNDFGGSFEVGAPHPTALPFTSQISVARAAIPEPASWATMLLGFFGLGATLRGRRRGGATQPTQA